MCGRGSPIRLRETLPLAKRLRMPSPHPVTQLPVSAKSAMRRVPSLSCHPSTKMPTPPIACAGLPLQRTTNPVRSAYDQESSVHDQESLAYDQESLVYDQESLAYDQESSAYHQESRVHERPSVRSPAEIGAASSEFARARSGFDRGSPEV